MLIARRSHAGGVMEGDRHGLLLGVLRPIHANVVYVRALVLLLVLLLIKNSVLVSIVLATSSTSTATAIAISFVVHVSVL